MEDSEAVGLNQDKLQLQDIGLRYVDCMGPCTENNQSMARFRLMTSQKHKVVANAKVHFFFRPLLKVKSSLDC